MTDDRRSLIVGNIIELLIKLCFCIIARCPFCANRKVLAGFNDLASRAEEILPYWGDENPDPSTVYWKSKKEYIFNCPECGEKHWRSVFDVVSGRICRNRGNPQKMDPKKQTVRQRKVREAA